MSAHLMEPWTQCVHAGLLETAEWDSLRFAQQKVKLNMAQKTTSIRGMLEMILQSMLFPNVVNFTVIYINQRHVGRSLWPVTKTKPTPVVIAQERIRVISIKVGWVWLATPQFCMQRSEDHVITDPHCHCLEKQALMQNLPHHIYLLNSLLEKLPLFLDLWQKRFHHATRRQLLPGQSMAELRHPTCVSPHCGAARAHSCDGHVNIKPINSQTYQTACTKLAEQHSTDDQTSGVVFGIDEL